MMRCRRNRLSLLAATVSILAMLSGCGGGGMPGFKSLILETNEIEGVLSGLRSDSKSPALARFGADPPPPGAVTCAALLLGCEGGLGPVHYRAVGGFDFSGFRFIERRRGVSLAERRRVSGGGSDTTSYRALAGWTDHGFFLLKTPGIEIASEENRVSANYYGAYSIGNAIDSNPDVSAGGAATWSGMMVGIRIAEPDGFVKGDATITVSSRQGNPDLLVDVEFRNMKDEQAGVNFDDVSWEGLALTDGSFGHRSRQRRRGRCQPASCEEGRFRPVLRPEPRGSGRLVQFQGARCWKRQEKPVEIFTMFPAHLAPGATSRGC